MFQRFFPSSIKGWALLFLNDSVVSFVMDKVQNILSFPWWHWWLDFFFFFCETKVLQEASLCSPLHVLLSHFSYPLELGAMRLFCPRPPRRNTELQLAFVGHGVGKVLLLVYVCQGFSRGRDALPAVMTWADRSQPFWPVEGGCATVAVSLTPLWTFLAINPLMGPSLVTKLRRLLG